MSDTPGEIIGPHLNLELFCIVLGLGDFVAKVVVR